MYSMSDLLQLTVSEGASDLHLRVGIPPVIRVHGRLNRVDGPPLSPEDTEELSRSITSEDHIQAVREQGGADFGFAFGEMARFRVSVFKERGNFAMVLRQIPNKLLTMEQIGLPASVRELLYKPRGLVLVTGPTGSGKSTTLASMIDVINIERDEAHIITVEDPIEYYHHHKQAVVTQREVHVDVPSFAEALRRALRQDPDIILVGEMRDQETMEIGMRGALTGHLVLSTLHTNDAISSALRLMDMGAPGYLVAAALRTVIAQRLVRKICPYCKEVHELEPSEKTYIDMVIGEGSSNAVFKRGRGCQSCNFTGYAGRVGVFEVLELSVPMMDALRSNDTERFSKVAREDPNYRPLVMMAFDYAKQGVTTVDEVLHLAEVVK